MLFHEKTKTKQKKHTHTQQQQAVITLTEKKGKDRSFLDNWRPISLVNVDEKIMSKAKATRIKNVLPNIIHHNQTGFIEDRYIGETVRSIFDIMDFTAKQDISGLLIFIDFQKAFDNLERNFLQRCLESFNFGPNFIRLVMTFYKNIESCIINNGITSNYFNFERGVRQGDPLSPYLFVMTVEALAIPIRQNSAIKGITIDKKRNKAATIRRRHKGQFSRTLLNSAQTLFKLLDDFKKLSGLDANPTKTEGMWIGSLRESKTNPFGIKWPSEPIKALGFYYSCDQKLVHEKRLYRKPGQC